LGAFDRAKKNKNTAGGGAAGKKIFRGIVLLKNRQPHPRGAWVFVLFFFFPGFRGGGGGGGDSGGGGGFFLLVRGFFVFVGAWGQCQGGGGVFGKKKAWGEPQFFLGKPPFSGRFLSFSPPFFATTTTGPPQFVPKKFRFGGGPRFFLLLSGDW